MALGLTENSNGHDESQINEQELHGESAASWGRLEHLMYVVRLVVHSPGSHQDWTPMYRGS